ncbi:MAG: hypothetical protein FWF50_00340, partial [Defluviitaleaceae bacterium]|nr:hypothetical protein [Defluviitaleaceae bacterium]
MKRSYLKEAQKKLLIAFLALRLMSGVPIEILANTINDRQGEELAQEVQKEESRKNRAEMIESTRIVPFSAMPVEIPVDINGIETALTALPAPFTGAQSLVSATPIGGGEYILEFETFANVSISRFETSLENYILSSFTNHMPLWEEVQNIMSSPLVNSGWPIDTSYITVRAGFARNDINNLSSAWHSNPISWANNPSQEDFLDFFVSLSEEQIAILHFVSGLMNMNMPEINQLYRFLETRGLQFERSFTNPIIGSIPLIFNSSGNVLFRAAPITMIPVTFDFGGFAPAEVMWVQEGFRIVDWLENVLTPIPAADRTPEQARFLELYVPNHVLWDSSWAMAVRPGYSIQTWLQNPNDVLSGTHNLWALSSPVTLHAHFGARPLQINVDFTTGDERSGHTLRSQTFGHLSTLNRGPYNDRFGSLRARKQNYKFIGWYLDSAFTEPMPNIVDYNLHNGRTVYARYAPNSAAINDVITFVRTELGLPANMYIGAEHILGNNYNITIGMAPFMGSRGYWGHDDLAAIAIKSSATVTEALDLLLTRAGGFSNTSPNITIREDTLQSNIPNWTWELGFNITINHAALGRTLPRDLENPFPEIIATFRHTEGRYELSWGGTPVNLDYQAFLDYVFAQNDPSILDNLFDQAGFNSPNLTSDHNDWLGITGPNQLQEIQNYLDARVANTPPPPISPEINRLLRLMMFLYDNQNIGDLYELLEILMYHGLVIEDIEPLLVFTPQIPEQPTTIETTEYTTEFTSQETTEETSQETTEETSQETTEFTTQETTEETSQETTEFTSQETTEFTTQETTEFTTQETTEFTSQETT